MTQPEKLSYKNTLKLSCQFIIEQRIAAVKAAIDEAQQAANQQEKSSAGDKYETSRAMGHLEKDLQSRQLAAHLKELASLHAVNINLIYTKPVTGAFIQSTQGSFFIAAGLGRQLIQEVVVIFLSPHAPLALALLPKKKGDSFVFNGKEHIITDIY